MNQESYENGFSEGRKDALDYIIKRGNWLLESKKLTDEMVFGVCLLMGIAKAEREKTNDN